MNRWDFFPITWTVACAGVVVVAWVALLGDRPPTFLWSEVSAAWMQAVGSIAAIAAAVWIDRGSARRSREREAEARHDRIMAGRSAVEYACNAASWVRECVEEAHGDSAGFDPSFPWTVVGRSLRLAQYQLDRGQDDAATIFGLMAVLEIMPRLQEVIQAYDKSGLAWARLGLALDAAEAELGQAYDEMWGG